MPRTGQIIQIVVFCLIFVVPLIIRMVKAAAEAKERRRLDNLRQFQANEAMRTGRPVEQVMASQGMAQAPPRSAPQTNPQGSAQDRLREMAARRQAQIDALRRQRLQTPQAGPPASRPATAYQQTAGESAATAFQQKPGVATGYQQQAPVATGYQQKAPVSTGYQPVARTQPNTQPNSQQNRQGQRSGRRGTQNQPPTARREAAKVEQEFPQPTGEIGGSTHDHDGDFAHRLVPDAAPTPATPTGGSGATRSAPGVSMGAGVGKVGIGELRRAIVLREILSSPMALREPDTNQ